MALVTATLISMVSRLAETAPETPVMDLTWWGWLLVVGVAIVVAGLAMAWQASHEGAVQGGHGEEAEHH